MADRKDLFSTTDFVAAMRASNAEFEGDAKAEAEALGLDLAAAFAEGMAAAAVYRERGIPYDVAIATAYAAAVALGLRLLSGRLRDCERALAETAGERDELHEAIEGYLNIERPVTASAYWARPDGGLRRAIGV